MFSHSSRIYAAGAVLAAAFFDGIMIMKRAEATSVPTSAWCSLALGTPFPA